jgi:hypothetical protein
VGADDLYDKFNALVRRHGAVRADSYLNAPLYYALTGRKGAWLHEGYGAALVVCQHPNVPDRLLVFPEMGEAGGKLAASVIARLEAPANGVQLARFTDRDLDALKGALAGEFNGAAIGIRKTEENTLDWRYPVHILDTKRVAALEGAAYARIRNKCRKVEETTETVPLDDPRALQMMRAAQKYWEGSMILRGRDRTSGTGEDLSGYYQALFTMIEASPDKFKGLVFIRDGRPVGFTVSDTPFEGTSNLLANLTDAAIPGIADFQIVATCRALAAAGTASLNFGGSETESLDQFKRKFMPHSSLEVHSAEVVYKKTEPDANVTSTKLAFF